MRSYSLYVFITLAILLPFAAFAGTTHSSLSFSKPTALFSPVPTANTTQMSVAPQMVAVHEASATRGLLSELFGGWTAKPRRLGKMPKFRPAQKRKSETRIGSNRRFRTVCVRLCDGYYWPIDFDASGSNLRRDNRVCKNSCNSPARMYYHYNRSDDIANMRDLRGNRYKRLNNAFLYRTKYVNSCKCKADPWTEEAKMSFKRRVAWAKRKKSKTRTATNRSRTKRRNTKRRLAAQRQAYLKKRRSRVRKKRRSRKKRHRRRRTRISRR